MKGLIIVLFIATTALVGYTSCKKSNSPDEKTTLSGVVVRFPTRLPVAGLKVYLVRQGATFIVHDMRLYWSINYLDTLAVPPMYRIDSTLTDPNGKYSFLYDPSDCSGYPCYGIYYTTVLDPAYTIVPYGSPLLKNDTMYVDYPSYFRLNMHKITAATTTDTLFERRDFVNDHNQWFSTTAFRKAQIGQTNVAITDTFSSNAYSKVIVEWCHYKNGLQHTSIDTISLVPNGTTVFNVSY